VRYAFIDDHQAQWPVAVQCDVLDVARSGYYAWRRRGPRQSAQRRAELTERIREVHAASRQTYGAPRVHAELIARGHRCNRKTVAKYSGATSTARVKGEFANQKKNTPAATAAGANSMHFADEQVKSSRNVSRDDRTPLELFLAGLCGWDSILRRHFPGKIGGNTLP
jgi:hypothetical protein